MAFFFQYFSSNVPDLSASLNVQYLPVDLFIQQMEFPCAAAKFEV